MAKTEQSARLGRTSPGAKAFLAWGVLRVPVILLILYLFRGPISELSVFDGDAITLRIIDLLSLPISRILLFLAFAGVLAGIAIVSARLRPLHGYLLLTGATLVLTLWLFWSTATPLRHALIPLILAAANFLPAAVFTRYLDNNGDHGAVHHRRRLQPEFHQDWRLAVGASAADLPDLQPDLGDVSARRS